MSDTPKTDKLAKREFVTDGVWIRHARELERENAALREDKERLTDAAEEVLNTYILTVREETGHPCPENLVICRDLRAAIDAARKEAQP